MATIEWHWPTIGPEEAIKTGSRFSEHKNVARMADNAPIHATSVQLCRYTHHRLFRYAIITDTLPLNRLFRYAAITDTLPLIGSSQEGPLCLAFRYKLFS